jgi:hypothetical protein
VPAKRLNTRIQNVAALDSRVWKGFTEGAVAVLIKSPHKCGGCGKTLAMGDVACRVTANEDLHPEGVSPNESKPHRGSIKYLCSGCYDNFKRVKRYERRSR